MVLIGLYQPGVYCDLSATGAAAIRPGGMGPALLRPGSPRIDGLAAWRSAMVAGLLWAAEAEGAPR